MDATFSNPHWAVFMEMYANRYINTNADWALNFMNTIFTNHGHFSRHCHCYCFPHSYSHFHCYNLNVPELAKVEVSLTLQVLQAKFQLNHLQIKSIVNHLRIKSKVNHLRSNLIKEENCHKIKSIKFNNLPNIESTKKSIICKQIKSICIAKRSNQSTFNHLPNIESTKGHLRLNQ